MVRYSMPSKRTPEALAHMCNEGCCIARNGMFSCPFSFQWPDTASKCGRVSVEMWKRLVVEEPLSEEEEARRDCINLMARKGHVERLIKELGSHDLINRMSLQGELNEISEQLEELLKKHPESVCRD